MEMQNTSEVFIDTATNGKSILVHRCNSVVIDAGTNTYWQYVASMTANAIAVGKRNTSPKFAIANPSLLDIDLLGGVATLIMLCTSREALEESAYTLQFTRLEDKCTSCNSHGELNTTADGSGHRHFCTRYKPED